MKQVNVITILSLTAVVLAMMAVPAMAVPSSIDGDLHDWNLGALYIPTNWNSETSWVPNPDSSSVYFSVEDNKYKDYVGNDKYKFSDEYWYRNTGGVHIKRTAGTSGTYEDNPEGLLNGYYQPSGGEICDLEAIYIDSTPGTIYFAIIHSIRGQDDQSPEMYMGDLMINVGGDTYGIVLNGPNKGDVYKNPTWKLTGSSPNPWSGHWGWVDNSEPWRVDQAASASGKVGTGTVAWNTVANALPQDNYHVYTQPPKTLFTIHSGENYVIEGAIPANLLGNPTMANLETLCWCGNDVLQLGEVKFEIPEFTIIAIPAGMIIGLFYLFRRKRQSKRE